MSMANGKRRDQSENQRRNELRALPPPLAALAGEGTLWPTSAPIGSPRLQLQKGFE
jgi:hypothetical protein